ncbi:MAG: Fe-S protein assembly chaperone HscA [Magnetococcales bacterium]|nr:Fe-S protein assembly chaperone HscA [Magnetococcales bacterium]
MDVLLDIAEPGQSLKPHEIRMEQQRRVVGIDLGTTYSLVSAVNSEGIPACIPDESGSVSLPSVVHYPDQADREPIIGQAAREMMISHPTSTIASAKRFMGRGLADLHEEAARTPFILEEGEGGMVQIRIHNQPISPVGVSAEILKSLKNRAEEALGGEISGAVITVPAYFDDAQRQATKDAGRLAGLEVLRLVNEPTAAALAYGLDQGREGMYAIYDLGGGTFDISILKLTQGVFQVMSTGGNSALGGDDFDHCLADLFIQEMGEKNPSASLIQGCKKAARWLKEQLTDKEQASITLTHGEGEAYQRTVTRAEFDGLINKLIRATGLPCRRALKDAGITADELKGVVLVGGSTRVPAVRAFVAELFKQEPLIDVDPDQVVALGAAYQADLLSGNRRDGLLLLDVSPLSLGIETMGELVEKIIPRNSPIPTARAQEFTTFKDGQTAMAIHVVQGERELVSQCRSLARFELRGIPPMTAGAARIRVTFQVDADGLLTVSAREETTKMEQSVMVKPAYGLSDGEIETMLRDAINHGAEDMRIRLFNEAKVDADRVLAASGAALKQDGDLLNEAETKKVKAAMLRLWETTQGKDHEAINQSIRELDRDTTFFAQRRMDRGVQSTMTGRRVEDFS